MKEKLLIKPSSMFASEGMVKSTQDLKQTIEDIMSTPAQFLPNELTATIWLTEYIDTLTTEINYAYDDKSMDDYNYDLWRLFTGNLINLISDSTSHYQENPDKYKDYFNSVIMKHIQFLSEINKINLTGLKNPAIIE